MPNLLNILIWFPIISATLMLFFVKSDKSNLGKYLALLTVLVSLGMAVVLMLQFNPNQSSMQFELDTTWISLFNIRYHLGVDGLSLILIALSIFTNIIVIFSTWNSIQTKLTQYLACFLILQGLLVGVFASMDAILFYVFWEATLIPMYLIIGIWGSDRRVYAAIKFFLYTFLGSVLMLAALIYVAYQTGSFDIQTMYAAPLTQVAQNFIFIAFLLAFAIKVPMFPVHTWLPVAHTESPAGGPIRLAATLLNLGA